MEARAPDILRPALAILTAVICLFTSVGAFSAETGENRKVRIASFSFPPILHTATSGDFSGTMGETVKALCEKADLDCGFDVVPLKRAYKQLRNGSVDALITIDVRQLTDCCIASEWSSPWTAGFFSMGGSDIPDTAQDLVGRSLIVVNGMKSPYSFAGDLDQMANDGRVALYRAPHILSSVRMFLHKRAPLLWGGEDFKWYLEKVDPATTYKFAPRFMKPVVVWVRKDRPDILSHLNQAFHELREKGEIGEAGLLNPRLMDERYQDAPFAE